MDNVTMKQVCVCVRTENGKQWIQLEWLKLNAGKMQFNLLTRLQSEENVTQLPKLVSQAVNVASESWDLINYGRVIVTN